MAYDNLQCTLALGTQDGVVKVYGRDLVERTFSHPSKLPVKFLRFLQNQGKLISVDARDKIYVWDLATCRLFTSSPPMMHLEASRT